MKIRAKVPEGFVMLIEESFIGANKSKIFVFENIKSKKRLYAKLCSPEDIKIGLVWEILDPEDLKELEIEESANIEYYIKERLIEESATGIEPWNPTSGESFEDYKRRMQGKQIKGEITKKQLDDVLTAGGSVNIYLGGESKSEDNSKDELMQENEDLKNKISIIAKRKFDSKKKLLNAPEYIRTPEELMDWEKIRGNLDPTEKSSSGTLSLAGQTAGGSGMEFESQEEMIAELQRRKNSPKASPQEKREAKAILDALWLKSIKGKIQTGELKDEGTPLLTKFLEEWRKRRKMSHEW